jgi:hypothetical protein
LHPNYDAAHGYWKVKQDPEIRVDVFANDWRYVDYVIATSQMLSDARRRTCRS